MRAALSLVPDRFVVPCGHEVWTGMLSRRVTDRCRTVEVLVETVEDGVRGLRRSLGRVIGRGAALGVGATFGVEYDAGRNGKPSSPRSLSHTLRSSGGMYPVN